MEELESTIQTLTARIASLETQVAALLQRVEAKHETSDTIRSAMRCPACGGRRFLHALRILDRSEGARGTEMAVTTTGFWAPKPSGRFQCFICRACGFVEWWVPEVDQLEPDDAFILEKDAEDRVDGGPYR